ncbi:MAG: hypothetical protein AB1345_04610 [Chloroflexota bacterium]
MSPPSSPQEYIPWYLNDSLEPEGRQAVETCLEGATQAQVEFVRQIQTSLKLLPQTAPAPYVRERLLARVAQPQPRWRFAWAWTGLLSVLLMVLVWMVLKPGVVLRWAVSPGEVAAFRVYRAPADDGEFTLVQEVTASPEEREYRVIDWRLLPGLAYVYLIEAVTPEGGRAFQQVVTADTWGALPGQLLVVVISMLMAYILVKYAQYVSIPVIWKGGGVEGYI